jgi:ribosomal protein S12 methylthiotransferase
MHLLHHPSMRGDLEPAHRRVMQEAESLVKAGVKSLVISQDTSAYGVDIKYRTGFGADVR